jgi:hypothetical protein
MESQLWRLSEQNTCSTLLNRPLAGCLVADTGDEHFTTDLDGTGHEQEFCEGEEEAGHELCHPGPHRLFGIFDVMNGKIEEYLFEGRIHYSSLVYIGGCTDCGCVDVGVGIMHHPDCGYDCIGDFPSVPLALQAMEELGYTLGSMATLGEKKLWSEPGKADSF